MELGINLGFAVKRWPEPAAWAGFVRDELGLSLVQFTFDLLDPWWPEPERRALARQVRAAAAAHDVTIHSAQLGLAWYTYNGLLHPDPAGRAVAREWWRRAAATAAEIGAPAVGGPIGALSVAEVADADARERRYAEALDDLVAIAEAAKAEGVAALLVEPTPLPREIPSSVVQTRRLLDDLDGRIAVPIRLVLDVGHALYRPLYGEAVALGDWLAPLEREIGVLHLQNHDYRSDAHWGWPDDRGAYDVARYAAEINEAGLTDVPTIVELFFPFELADAEVAEKVKRTVAHCRAALR